MEPVILVGDVGGTNTRFALASRRGGQIHLEHVKIYGDGAFATFDDALRHYFSETGGQQPRSACIAVAGPAKDGVVHLTHRNWTVSEDALSMVFGLPGGLVVNDFVAMARSVPELGPAAFDPVFGGKADPDAPILVTGPGTGFGVATLIPSGPGWTVLSGEGGHMAYAPRTELERQLAVILARDHGYVSNELVASGSGLPQTHAAICEIFGVPVADLSPAEMRDKADAGDPMYRALIELRALAVMGAAGDLALATGSLGGIVLAGGVTLRMADFLRTPQARERFCSRGPRTDYLEVCPIRLLKEPIAPLIGAAAYYFQTRSEPGSGA